MSSGILCGACALGYFSLYPAYISSLSEAPSLLAASSILL